MIVEASDGLNADRQALSVLVGNLNDNPVTITSNGGGPSAALTLDENNISVTVVNADDDDGTAPAYSIVGGADNVQHRRSDGRVDFRNVVRL